MNQTTRTTNQVTCSYCNNSQDGTDTYEVYDRPSWVPCCTYCFDKLTIRRRRFGSQRHELLSTGFGSPTVRRKGADPV